MIRRLQLLDPESQSSKARPSASLSAIIARLKDGLLRDNKVVPAVLGGLALLIFAWLIAGALMGGSDDGAQQTSNQASLAQGRDPKSGGGSESGGSGSEGTGSGGSETPAPGAENRDSDASYGGYDEPKDPFALPEGLRTKAAEGTNGSTKSTQQSSSGSTKSSQGSSAQANARSDRNGDQNGRNTGGSRAGSSRSDGGRSSGGDEENSVQQGSTGNQGVRGGAGSTAGAGRQYDAGEGGTDQGGGGSLFNSGGDLPAP